MREIRMYGSLEEFASTVRTFEREVDLLVNRTIDEKIFAFAYGMAFRDATLRKAFPKTENESDDTFHERKKRVFKDSKGKVKKYINDIFRKQYPDPLKVIEALCKNKNGFTFGNAQKLVNMTAKYMFLATYTYKSKKELFKNCHCPMDGVMMNKLSEILQEKEQISHKEAWSRMSIIDGKIPEEYLYFQEKVGKYAESEGISPIEVDFCLWDD